LVAKGGNAPSSANNYTNTIYRILEDLDGFEEISDCINYMVVEYITET